MLFFVLNDITYLNHIFQDGDCLNKENMVTRQKEHLLVNEEISINYPENISSKDKFRTITDCSFSTSLLAENNTLRTYTRIKENTDVNLISDQKIISMKENFTFKYLLKNLLLIKKPNIFWGITSHSNIIICARWNEDYICEKKVVIDNSLVLRVSLLKIFL